LGLDESKANKLTLEPTLGCFHGLDESQRCSPYLELFSQLDESKRAKKMLELVRSKELFQAWIERTNKVGLLELRELFSGLNSNIR
jgi:hypothetical protein